MSKPRITKRIVGRLPGISAMLDCAATELPNRDEDGTISGATDLYTGCETWDDVMEVRDAVDYVCGLLDDLHRKHALPAMTVNTRDERGVKQPLDRKAAEALAAAGKVIAEGFGGRA
jgi:hypothetical protein